MVTESRVRPEDDPLAVSAEADVALADLLEDPVISPSIEDHILNEDETMSRLSSNAKRRLVIKKGITFASALLNCLCAGTVMVFSLYAPQFQTRLGYTQVQVNILSILVEVGMYLTSPIVGMSADIYGSGPLSLMSGITFAVAYSLGNWSFSRPLPFLIMCIAFLLVGIGTACMYFGSITACAKTFTTNRGLALGVPITAYGLSSLWQSQLIAWLFTDKSTGDVFVSRLFTFYAIFLFFIGSIASVGFFVGYRPDLEQSYKVHRHTSIKLGSNEDTPLISGEDSDGTNHAISIEAEEHAINDEGDIKDVSLTRKQMISEFVRDWTAWGLAAGLFATTGPGEMFMNNMGSVIRSIGTPGPSTALNVAVHSFFSSSMRIVAGVLSDVISRGPHKQSRMLLLLFFAVVLTIGHFLVGFGGVQAANGWWFWLVSALLGSGYGAVFTLAPTIVSLVWGADRFGTHWGVLFVFPAIGSIIYEMIYASIYDYHTEDRRLCYGLSCYGTTFLITGASCVFAAFAWLSIWRLGWNRCGVFV
ncbi:major facilitator superfamily domain-containing protein [Lipomyces arxii]|uniref:major facilitator superfamily domain-containing protein n=1 Tax=Lipomyces arxii TaxID=56418 RepID=UPI0034CDCA32